MLSHYVSLLCTRVICVLTSGFFSADNRQLPELPTSDGESNLIERAANLDRACTGIIVRAPVKNLVLDNADFHPQRQDQLFNAAREFLCSLDLP